MRDPPAPWSCFRGAGRPGSWAWYTYEPGSRGLPRIGSVRRAVPCSRLGPLGVTPLVLPRAMGTSQRRRPWDARSAARLLHAACDRHSLPPGAARGPQLRGGFSQIGGLVGCQTAHGGPLCISATAKIASHDGNPRANLCPDLTSRRKDIPQGHCEVG